MINNSMLNKKFKIDGRSFVVRQVLIGNNNLVELVANEIQKSDIPDCGDTDSAKEHVQLAKWWIEKKRLSHGNLKSVREMDVADQAAEIEKLIRLDGYSIKQIRSVLEFADEDTGFWRDNLISLKSLRKASRTGGLTKFDTIMLRVPSVKESSSYYKKFTG